MNEVSKREWNVLVSTRQNGNFEESSRDAKGRVRVVQKQSDTVPFINEYRTRRVL